MYFDHNVEQSTMHAWNVIPNGCAGEARLLKGSVAFKAGPKLRLTTSESPVVSDTA